MANKDNKVIPIKKPYSEIPIIGETIPDYTKPVGTIYGVQLWEDGVLKGVCLYTDNYKAKQVADACNRKFAELKVKHEAKQLNYPIY